MTFATANRNEVMNYGYGAATVSCRSAQAQTPSHRGGYDGGGLLPLQRTGQEYGKKGAKGRTGFSKDFGYRGQDVWHREFNGITPSRRAGSTRHYSNSRVVAASLGMGNRRLPDRVGKVCKWTPISIG